MYAKCVLHQKKFYVSCHDSSHKNFNMWIPKRYGHKEKNDLSTRAWYITYQAYTTINKNYERVTEADTHKIPELYVIKTEIKERGLFLLGELNSPFTWSLQKCYIVNMMMIHNINIWNKTKANKIDCSSRVYNRTSSCL